LISGKDLKSVSALDLAMAQPRDSATACRQGVGALVAKLGETVPIVLSTPVTRITWSGRDVQVETSAGNLSARAVILTCSTNILSSGKIRFSPELPKRQLDAAANLSLGSYDHIALELSGNPLGLARDDVVIEQSTDNRTGVLLANLGGSSLCQVDVAGSFGRELSSRGEAAMVAFAIEWLGKLFGSDAVRNVKSTAATRWNDMPYVLGAMSAAAPGGQPSRKMLTEPLNGLFLAGEAAHETQWGTVGGAWESGERAADAALRRVNGAKDTTVSVEPAKRTRRQEAQTMPYFRSEAGGLAWPKH
jgi:monoamine oxidase